MVFSTAEFLFFFLPITILIYFSPICRNMKVKNIWLLFVSLVFYAWGEPAYLVLMVCSIVVNWQFGCSLADRQGTKAGKRLVALAVVFNLGVLFVMKYLNWILGLFGFVAVEGSWLASLTLPVGISFYTFQAMSYVIDVYRGNADPEKNILYVGLYISFFPQLIAGPIVRYEDIARQIRERTANWEKFRAGLWRFAVGLAKKMLLANQLAVLAELSFDMTADERSVLMAWMGALAYTFQIFFDFSGYSDMAIGLAKMFGFDLKENFNYPYISRSVTEFWKRWHISLTTWFREYVYFPLGGNRCSRAKWARNFFLIWLLTGIWHGANFTFLFWGLAQGAVAALERLGKPMERKGWKAVIGFLFTAVFTLLSWTMFNSATVADAFAYYSSMFKLAGNHYMGVNGRYWFGQFKVLLIAAAVFSTPVVSWITKKLGGWEEKPTSWETANTGTVPGKDERIYREESREEDGRISSETESLEKSAGSKYTAVMEQVRKKKAQRENRKARTRRAAAFAWAAARTILLIVFFVVCCGQAIAGDYNPFIYFNF